MLNNIAALLDSGVTAAATDYESIATASGTGSSGTITFSSISGSYSHLQIRWIARASTAGAVYVRLNSDGGSNYSGHILYGNGTSALANAQSATNIPLIIRDGGISTVANTMTAGVFDLLDYASTSKNSTYRNLGGQDKNGSGVIELASGAWYNTAAVTSISFIHNGGNFTTDTRFALYGIK